MSDTDFLPVQENELKSWLDQFTQFAAANKAAFGLTDAQLLEIQSEVSDFNQSLFAEIRQRNALRNATLTKNTARANVERLMRKYNAQFQGDPNLSDTMKQGLGLKVRGSRTLQAPNPPETLNLSGDAQGNLHLKWNRNGNPAPTLFVIEGLIGDAREWQIVGQTLGTKFALQIPRSGIALQFRVKAVRRKISSTYSNTVML